MAWNEAKKALQEAKALRTNTDPETIRILRERVDRFLSENLVSIAEYREKLPDIPDPVLRETLQELIVQYDEVQACAPE